MNQALLRRYSLRTSLIATILVLLVPSILVIGIFNSLHLYYQAQRYVNEEVEQSVASYSDLINSEIDYYLAQLSVMAYDPRLQDIPLNDPVLADILEEYIQNTDFSAMLYIDSTGTTSAGSTAADRSYFLQSFEQGKLWMSSPIISRSSGRTVLVASAPVRGSSGEICGVLVGHIAIEDFYGILNNLSVGESGYGFIVDSSGQLVAHPDTQRVVELDNVLERSRQGNYIAEDIIQDMLTTADATVRYTDSYPLYGQQYYFVYTRITGASEEWILTIAVNPDEFLAGAKVSVAVTLALMGVILVIGIALAFAISRSIVRSVGALAGTAEQLALGDVNVEVETKLQSELRALSEAMGKIAEAVKAQSSTLHTIAQGDYTAQVTPRSPEDVMGHSLVQLLASGNRAMLEMRSAAGQVAASSEQLLNAAQTLSAGAAEQTATVEQFTSSLEEVNRHTLSNQENANNVLDVVLETNHRFTQGMDALQQVVDSMDSIQENAQNMAGIIKMIEDIAMGTNILALNASVEAARAGVHGKGFAVVASEVRSLAVKCSAAARQTADLISGSLGMTEQGSEYARQTSTYMDQTAEYSRRCIQHAQSITESSELQKSAFAQITLSLQQISKIIQSNASVSEETASAAQELTLQAEDLYKIVQQFQLSNDHAKNGGPLPAGRRG